VNASTDVVSVVLVDDHTLIREGLRRALERDSELRVVGEAGSLRDGERLVCRSLPDVVVIDIRLPDGSGIDLVRSLVAQYPEMGLVVLTMYAGDDQVLGARDAGASAFVSKDAPVDDVVIAVRHAVAQPRTFLADGLEDVLERVGRSSPTRLTQREREVLDLLAEGLGVAAISRRLFISESTTKTHVAKIYTKLGAANRAQALMTASREGLLPPSLLG
jgi:DNA-binding NarL/FixJ family response regulator